MVGPVLQQDLFSIVTRFRFHNYVLTADISKMYRQILVNPSQRQYQRILWRLDENQAVSAYKLNTVTYGTASASFLAVRCLQQLAEEAEVEYPVAAGIIRNDFYMDDLLTGAKTKEEAINIREDVTRILGTGGFRYTSGHPTTRQS